MKNFVRKGEAIDVLAPADVLSGTGVLIGSMFGIACGDAKAGADLVIQTEGVHELPKVSAQAWTQGALVYWDNGAGNCTTTVGSNTKIGVAISVASSPSATGLVRLNGAYT